MTTVINGNLTVNGTVSAYLDTSLNSLPENNISFFGNFSDDTNKWFGGVLAPNGKIYGIPSNSTSVLIIDPVTNTVDTTTITGLTGSNKWRGGVLAPNGKIYGIPYNNSSVLIIDPVTNTVDTTTISGLLSVASKWAGGVLAPNGKIYCIPTNYTSVLSINTGLPSVAPWMLQPQFNKF